MKDPDFTLIYMSGFYDGEKKWKDKIKNTIKGLDETKQYWTEEVIELLEALLKEKE